MDFSIDETDAVLAGLAAEIFAGEVDDTRRRAAELDAAAGGDGVDAALWQTLTAAGVFDAFADGDGPGAFAAALVCREHGLALAPVPMWSALSALLAARDAPGEAPSGRGVVAVTTPGREPLPTVRAGHLDGFVPAVTDLPGAGWALVATSEGLFRIATAEARLEHVVTTDRSAAGHLHLDGTPAEQVGDLASVERTRQVTDTLIAATQAGVCTGAITQTAAYLTTRQQFGRTLSTFQAPVHRLVDAHIDTDAIWLTTQLAAWRLDAGLDAASAVDVARWWAAEAGHRTVHTTQHLHGGIGSDIDYPIHRTFLWAKQLADTLGGSASHAAHLGTLLAAEAHR